MSFLSGLGRALKKFVKSPIGKVITIAAAAYVAVPAISAAFSTMASGAGASAALGAAGRAAAGQFTGGIGQGISNVFGGSGQPEGATGYEGATGEGGKIAPTSASSGGGGIMDKALNFMGTQGGGMLTSAALKLAGGALTPNETAMRINYEEQKRQEDLARLKQNTAVGGLNFASMPAGTRPQDRLPVPPAPVTLEPRRM